MTVIKCPLFVLRNFLIYGTGSYISTIQLPEFKLGILSQSF